MFCCFGCQPKLAVNGRRYEIVRLIGEGSFGFVYLVEGRDGQRLAIKKLRCVGAEGVQAGLRELETLKKVRGSEHVVRLVDSGVQQEPDGSKTVYLVMEYYERSVQDVINEHEMNGTRFDVKQSVRLFIGICRGLRSLHRFRQGDHSPADENDDENEHLLGSATELANYQPLVHLDLKPQNVLLDRTGSPVLVDLGSVLPATEISSKRQCAELQEFVNSNSSIGYRAPELFDLKPGSSLSPAADVWSAGCVLYAMHFGMSPFELEYENGGSIQLAVLSCKINYDGLDHRVRPLVEMCLQKLASRPSVDDVLAKAQEVYASL